MRLYSRSEGSGGLLNRLTVDSLPRRVAAAPACTLTNRAWEQNGDTPIIGEKLAAWIVTTAMNAKSKMGASGAKSKKKKNRNKSKVAGTGRRNRIQAPKLSFAEIVRNARAAVRGSGIKSSKSVEKDVKLLRKAVRTALIAARKLKKGRTLLRPVGGRRRGGGKTGVGGERVLPLPKTGGLLPLLPIFAGLSAIGSLAGGAAGVAKAISETRDAGRRLAELKRHNETMEAVALRKGKGLFLKPHSKTGGLGLYMMPYSQYAKNC